MFLNPSSAHVSEELLFIGAHLADERLVASFFVARRPEDHFGKYGSKIDAFGRQCIKHFPAIRRIAMRCEDTAGFQPAQTVRQNVGRDFFVRMKEFVKGLVAAKHHVAQNQQRPAVAQHFNRGVQGATRAALWHRFLFSHNFRVHIITCKLQVKWADCFQRGENKA